MNKVRFEHMVGGAYICNCSDKFCPINHSGIYYPAADVERLVEAARDIYGVFCISPNKPNANFIEKLKAALEPFKEVK